MTVNLQYNPSQKPDLDISGHCLKNEQIIKLLSFVINENLKWHDHIELMSAKLNKN